MTVKSLKKQRTPVKLSRVFKHLFLILVSFLSAFPFYWMMVSSTNESIDVVRGRMLPGKFLAENFAKLTENGQLWVAFKNSVVFTLIITFLALLVSSLAGYGFITFADKKKNVALNLILLSMMVPAAATLIPLFRFFSQMSLFNSPIAYILPSIATAFLIFMFYQSAHSFPQEMVQAARIDGLGEFGIFFKIFVPIMKPTYAAAATITFMSTWNSYLWPLVILQDRKTMTMPIFVANLQTGYVLDYGMIMLGVAITTLPTLIVFFLLQKSFVAGILGSLK